MKLKNDNSVSYKNLLLKKPIWSVRYGSSLMLAIILLVFLMSYLISYPEYIEARINIVSENHIKRLIARNAGEIYLKENNGSYITSGEELAYINSPSRDILKVRKILDSINKNVSILENQNFILDQNINLGDLEPYYVDFIKKRNDFFVFKNIAIKRNNKDNLQYSLRLNKKVENEITKEKMILEKKLDVEREKLKRMEKLSSQGIISKNDYNKAQQDFFEYERNIQNNIISNTQVSIKERDVSNDINNLDYQIKEDELKHKQELTNSFNRLQAEIKNWQYNYVFTSPADGKIVFSNNWSDGQYIAENQEFAVIIPKKESEIFCIGLMESLKSGKVQIGQKVKIYLDSYNFEEYGILNGIVYEIYPIPDKDKEGKYFYRIKIKLLNGLKSSLGKNIPYTPDLNGKAKIITKDISLLERLFLKLRKATEQ